MDKPLIMVVEDDVAYAGEMASLLRTVGGYETVTAHSANEAFDRLKKHRTLLGFGRNKIRLILLDIKMPGLDGLQFLEQLRKKYADDKIGVIMVTAYEDGEKWEKATNNWVAGYITKPFPPDRLIDAVDRFFSADEAYVDMTLETMDEHISKREEFEKKKEPGA